MQPYKRNSLPPIEVVEYERPSIRSRMLKMFRDRPWAEKYKPLQVGEVYRQYGLPMREETGVARTAFAFKREAVVALRQWAKSHRARRKARHLGLAYWPALLEDEAKVNPLAYIIAERILHKIRSADPDPEKHLLWGEKVKCAPGETPIIGRGGWDSMGHWGISPSDVRQSWYCSGCRNNAKFRWMIATSYHLAGSDMWKTYRRAVRDNTRTSRAIRRCRALVWLNKVRHRNRNDAKVAVIDALGRLNGFERAAALAGVDLATASVADLNWEMVKVSKKWNRAKKAARWLKPSSAWSYLYKLRVRDEAWPHPAGLKLKALTGLIAGKSYRQADYGLEIGGMVVPVEEAIPVANLALLFGSVEAVERYRKIVAKGAKPISDHDLGQFTLPNRGGWDKAGWARLALKHGRAVVQYGQLFNVIEENLGRVPSNLRELREVAARMQYRGIATAEDEAVGLACAEHQLSQVQFEAYKALMKRVKTAESIPAVKLIEGDWVFDKLEADDPTGPLLGLATNCCQHLHGAGAACARHGVESANSGFYVVRYRGKIVAQSWSWRGTRGELVHDSIELLSEDYRAKVMALYGLAADRMIGRLGITAVLAGTGDGAASQGEDESCKKPAVMVEYCSYSDAHQQVWIRKAKRAKPLEQVPARLEDEPVNNELAEDSDVICEHCGVEVHPAAELCPACGQDIAEWV